MGQFVSEGASAADAILKTLAQQKAEERQRMLDEAKAQQDAQKAVLDAAKNDREEEKHRLDMAKGDQDLFRQRVDDASKKNVEVLMAARQGSVNAAQAQAQQPPTAPGELMNVPDPNAAAATRQALDVLLRRNGANDQVDKAQAQDKIRQWETTTDPAEKEALSQQLVAEKLLAPPQKPERPVNVQTVKSGNDIIKVNPDGTTERIYKGAPTASQIKAAGDAGTGQSAQDRMITAPVKKLDYDPTTDDKQITLGHGASRYVTTMHDMKKDAESILLGFNTIQHLKNSKGRSTSAAQYVSKVQSMIQDIEPNFDFVGSEGNAKAREGTYFHRAMAAINTVDQNIDNIKDLSSKVPRTGWQTLDKAWYAGKTETNDPALTKFLQERELLADEVGTALGNAAASDLKVKIGFSVTDPTVSNEVFASKMDIIRDFLDRRRTALDPRNTFASQYKLDKDKAKKAASDKTASDTPNPRPVNGKVKPTKAIPGIDGGVAELQDDGKWIRIK